MFPGLKLIALLRQPADRAWSAFLHHRRLGIETLRDFNKALKFESERQDRNWYPGWRYWQNGLYADNLKPYIELFGRKQIRIYLYDDWNEHPHAVMADIYQFLGIDDPFTPNLDIRYNVSLVPRSFWIQNQFQGKGLSSENRILRLIIRINQSQPQIPANIKQQLTERYCDSITALEKMLHRSLQTWRTK